MVNNIILENNQCQTECPKDTNKTYEVKFICKDDYQYTGQDITDYTDYVNPLGKGVYTCAKNATEALNIVINKIINEEAKNGYEVVVVHGNYLLLSNKYSEYLEFQNGIATIISPRQ